jgi:hypothetical protein
MEEPHLRNGVVQESQARLRCSSRGLIGRHVAVTTALTVRHREPNFGRMKPFEAFVILTFTSLAVTGSVVFDRRTRRRLIHTRRSRGTMKTM